MYICICIYIYIYIPNIGELLSLAQVSSMLATLRSIKALLRLYSGSVQALKPAACLPLAAIEGHMEHMLLKRQYATQYRIPFDIDSLLKIKNDSIVSHALRGECD